MSVKIKYKDKIIIEKLTIADDFKKRMIGLLNRKNMESNEGLLLYNCKQIHTFFMKFPIDVFFLDKNKKIIKIYEEIKPFKITNYIKNAKYALEAKAGISKKYKLKVGDILDLIKEKYNG